MTNSFLKYVLISACFLVVTDTFCPPKPATEPTLSEIIDALRAEKTIARDGTLAKLVRAGYIDARLRDEKRRLGHSETAPEVPTEGAAAAGTSEDAAATKPTLPKD